MLEMFLQLVISCVAPVVIFGVVEMIRSALVSRRREAVAGGDRAGILVRLRGAPPTYPGFWRPGYLDPVTARWRSRSFWGPPAALSGARIVSAVPADKRDYLPPFAAEQVVATYLDARGRAFQVTAEDTDMDQVRRCLRATRSAADRPLHQRVLLRRLRQYVPLGVPTVLGAAVLWLVFWGAPVLGQRVVDGVVVHNRGPEYLCVVSWADPLDGTDREGDAGCTDEAPGDPIQVHVLGWPRTDVGDQPAGSLTTGLLGAGLAVILAGIYLYSGFLQRRRVADAAAGRQGRPPPA